jgi:hypothetical protein
MRPYLGRCGGGHQRDGARALWQVQRGKYHRVRARGVQLRREHTHERTSHHDTNMPGAHGTQADHNTRLKAVCQSGPYTRTSRHTSSASSTLWMGPRPLLPASVCGFQR